MSKMFGLQYLQFLYDMQVQSSLNTVTPNTSIVNNTSVRSTLDHIVGI